MIKLSGRSLTPAGYLAPESMNLSLEERQGSATLVISPEEAAPEIGSWLQDDEDPGAGIVWRVKTIEENRSAGTLGVQLEHIVNTLRDDVIFGKVTPGMISGNPNDTTCSARDAAAYILQQTGTWTLGDFEFTHADAYAFDGEDLFSALGKVTGTLDGAVWEYDLGVFPFRLHVRRKSSAAQCEMREGRNISTLKRVIDRTRMYTRFYPIGENDLKLAGGYVSRNEQQYGTVSRIETDQSKKTEAELIAWANERLKKHAEPTVTVTISGLDLARSTGEPMDALAVNRMCQVPLPEFGTTILETITRLQWRDKVNEPENVTVTMANNVEDIASLLNSRTESSRRSARAGAQKAGEDHAWFVDTETHVGLVAEAIIGPGDDGVDWSRVASLIVDGGGIHARVTRAEGYFVALQSQLEMTEESLRVGFENALNSTRSEFAMTSESMRVAFENAISCTRSEFRMTSESMRVAFENDIASTRSEFRMTSESMRVAFENDIASTRTAIEAEAGRIGLVVEGYGANAQVKRASLILAINNGTSSAHLDADQVYIGNQKSTTVINGKLDAADVTADWLAAKFANTSVLSTNYMFTKSFEIGSGGFTMNDYSCNVPDAIWALDLVQSGNTYTLKKKHFYSLDWQTVGTFSRATTLSGAWSSGILTVSASPQGNNYTAQLSAAATTWDGNTGSRVIWDGTAADAQHGRLTGYTVSVDATVRYNAGVTDGKNAVTINKGSWSSGQISFTKSEGTASTKTVQLTAAAATWSGNTASVKMWDGTAADAQHGSDTGYTVSIDVSSKLDTRFDGTTSSRKITANDTYTPAEGKIGFSKVVVDVPQSGSISNVKARFKSDNGAYYIEAYDSTNGSGVSGSSVTYKLAATGSADSTKVQIQNTGNTMIQYTPELSVGYLYTDGQNSVNVSKGTWASGILDLSTSAGTGTGARVQLTAASETWSGNTASVKIWDGTGADAEHGSDTGYTVSVDASARYTAGQNSVNVSKGTWASGILDLSTSAGTGTGARVQLTAASATWSGNTASVKIWDGTAADSQRGSDTGYTVSVDASARYTAGQNSVNVNKGTWASGVLSLRPSAGTGTGSEVRLTKANPTWSGTTANIKIYDGQSVQQGSDTGCTVSITAAPNLPQWYGGSEPSGRTNLGSVTVGGGTTQWLVQTISCNGVNSDEYKFKINVPHDVTAELPGWYGSSEPPDYTSLGSVTIGGGSNAWMLQTVKCNNQNAVIYKFKIDASAVRTAGQNSVNVSKGTWASGVLSIETSAGTGTGAEVRLTKDTAQWDGNTASVKIYDGQSVQQGSDTGYTVTVDASGRYTAGQNSVNVSKGTWSSGILDLSTSAGSGSGARVQLTAASATWSGNTASVKIWDGTAADSQHGSDTGYTVSITAAPNLPQWYGSSEPSEHIDLGTVAIGGGSTAWMLQSISCNGANSDEYKFKIDASAVREAGQNSVNVSKGNWSGGQISFSTSAGSGLGSGARLSLGGSWAQDGTVCKYNYTIYDNWSGSAVSTGYSNSITANPWLNTASSEVNHQGTLDYDTLYGITLAGNTLATWRTPAQQQSSHSVSLTVDIGWTGSVAGYQDKGSYTASSLARTYIRVNASCGGSSVKRYWTIN